MVDKRGGNFDTVVVRLDGLTNHFLRNTININNVEVALPARGAQIRDCRHTARCWTLGHAREAGGSGRSDRLKAKFSTST